MGLDAPAPLLDAGIVLARNGIFGLAWLDAELFVTARYGDLAARLEVGAPLSEGLPVLADYTEDIAALPADGERSFELPGIMMIGPDGTPEPRVDVHVFRLTRSERGTLAAGDEPSAPGYLLLLSRASGQAATDMAVARYQRERHMLREEIAQQKVELERVNAELELCNRDLEDFAAIISHDLKAPMRTLRYLADEIDKGIRSGVDGSAADAKVTRACAELKEQSRRMSDMLSGLLDYASLGRRREVLEDVDTRALAEAIVASLPRPAGFEIVIAGHWPLARTYRAPLDLTLRNLIDNAIKHHDAPGEGRIEIVCSSKPQALSITVSDNGPGIPCGRHEAVFYPFRSYPVPAPKGNTDRAGTAASDDAPPASHGMGLAFVKRTVETAGGALSLVSDPSVARGSRFIIDWPLFSAD